MKQLEPNKLSKSELLQLKEENLLFITYPGRMGDEDGSTFIMKQGDEFIIYRVDGWMFPKEGERVEISLKDLFQQFPKWYDVLEHEREKDYHGKYKYTYMGFGNGLCVDSSIWPEFEPYLKKEVEEYLKDSSVEEKKSLQYAAAFNSWERAFLELADDKGYVLKQIGK